MSRAFAIHERGQIVGEAETAGGQCHVVLWNPLPAIVMLEVTSRGPDAGIRVSFTAAPPTSAATYRLETANAARGPWSTVAGAALTELKPDRYQFTGPFDAARALEQKPVSPQDTEPPEQDIRS